MARDARQAAVASFFAVCVLAQIGFNYRDAMNGAERSALVRLQSIATTTAATIDGDHLAGVLFRHRIPDSIGHGRSDRQYDEIQSRLAKVERENTLGTSLYTVHKTELQPGAVADPTDPPYWMGVTSAMRPTFRKAVELQPTIKSEFEHGGVVRAKNRQSMLAAFAPIRDSKDGVVGVLVVEEDAAPVWDAARWTFVANGFVYVLMLGLLGWVAFSGYKLRVRPEEKEYLHSHDPTTGLPNRSTLLVHLGSTIESDRRSGPQPTGVALVCLGLDRFRHLNAEAGPRAGDDVLRILARRLQGEAGSQSLVGRIAGDIFAVVQTGIATTDDAATYARRLLKVFEEPMRLDEQTLTVRATVGVSLFPIHAGEPGALLEAAEEALAVAKQHSRGEVGLFGEEARVNIKQRKTLEKHLETAIERGEFFLVYQPKVNRDTKLAGAEALLRWRSPELGPVSPGQFIPIAENNTGLITSLTYWVVRRVCDQMRAWEAADASGGELKVAINLSLIMFRDAAMVDRLCEIVTDAGIAPNNIELEITETGLQGNSEVTNKKLQALKAFGFRLSIDDFGTGYSSLHRLAEMPIDTLKIDRSFVNGLNTEFRNTIMVRTIIDLGHNLDMQVVAEGVEEERQLAYLREQGCDLLQGYLFDRPLDPDTFYAKWLKTDAPSNVLRLLGR